MNRNNKLNGMQLEYLSSINDGRNPSVDRAGNGFDLLLKRGLIEDKTPMSDICDGFRLTEKGRAELRGAESL